MLQIIESAEVCAAAQADWADADPLAVTLAELLQGCHHPRASRLKVRLLECRDAEQLAQLRSEITHLLTLSFGAAEAQRRLQTLQ